MALKCENVKRGGKGGVNVGEEPKTNLVLSGISFVTMLICATAGQDLWTNSHKNHAQCLPRDLLCKKKGKKAVPPPQD